MNRRLPSQVAPTLGMLALTSAAFAVPLSEALGFAIMAVSLVLFGLPHGAADLFLARQLNLSRGWGSFLQFCSIYLLLGGATFALCWLQPHLALGAFLLLTAWHWGTAETAVLSASFSTKLIHGLARGGVIVAAPIWFHPELAVPVLNGFINWLGANDWFTPAKLTWAQPVFWGCFAGDVVLSFRQVRNRPDRHSALVATEALVIPLFFFAVPPLCAIAFFFVFVHAWRHLIRLAKNESRLKGFGSTHRSENREALAIMIRSLPLALPPMLVMGLVYWLSPTQDLYRLTGLYLVVLFCLTVPHALLVLAWDYRFQSYDQVSRVSL